METCSKCGRQVRSQKGWHYCAKIDVDSLFEKKQDIVVHLFDRLIEVVGAWPGVSFSATKACIVFVTERGTFLVVKPMKRALDMHFNLAEQNEADCVYKSIKYGRQWIHYVRLQDEPDLNREVLRLLKMAYDR